MVTLCLGQKCDKVDQKVVYLTCNLKLMQLECQFSLVEGDLNLQKIPKLIPIPNKSTPGKK
jgi:hypothetical protein